ncbi:hypothetical protein [Solirubrobacter soli]|uniref:hypothetical protein n=1 Tax=Solirubrobacter soli TaxID=363832 RepID=UPI0012FA8E70|nr:hypothetical protein [Solirubrobacter soli]
MSFAWIRENSKRELADIYEVVGLLAMIAGHPGRNLVRVEGPAPVGDWPLPGDDRIDGRLTINVSAGPGGMIVECLIDAVPRFDLRQGEFSAGGYEFYDWGQYFGVVIETAGHRVRITDAYNH